MLVAAAVKEACGVLLFGGRSLAWVVSLQLFDALLACDYSQCLEVNRVSRSIPKPVVLRGRRPGLEADFVLVNRMVVGLQDFKGEKVYQMLQIEAVRYCG